MPTIDSKTWISPNVTSGRVTPISMIVVHATASDTLESAASWLCLDSSEVSTHYVIDEAGRIFQLVKDEDTAWHAGESKWRGLETTYKNGQKSVNPASIGVELVNKNDGKDVYEQAQIDALTWLVEWKARQYGIKRENIIRHLDCATPKGRKSDPAGFAWEKWLESLTFDLAIGDVWSDWGTRFPIYQDQKHFGIPQFWLKHRDQLGEARTFETHITSPADDPSLDYHFYSFQAFEHGVLIYDVEHKKVFGFLSNGHAIK